MTGQLPSFQITDLAPDVLFLMWSPPQSEFEVALYDGSGRSVGVAAALLPPSGSWIAEGGTIVDGR